MLYKMADWGPCDLFHGGNGTDAIYCRISEYPIQDDHAFHLCKCREKKEKKHVPVILDTDDKDKAARYEHLGMKLDRVRSCGERFHMYDLIRE